MTEPRRVLITGVGRGLGHELAKRLIDRGDTVWGSTRSGESDLDLAGVILVDLLDEASVVAGIADLASKTPALDVLINCAGADSRAFGAQSDQRGPFDYDATTFTDVLRVNATGPMLITREALPLLRQGDSALIVNVSSQLGSMQVAAEKGRDSAYCVGKAALNMLSVKTAAALQPEGIGVVMMHPGWVQTDMGGPSAPMSVAESGAAMVETISSLTVGDTGRFLRWDGTDHPW